MVGYKDNRIKINNKKFYIKVNFCYFYLLIDSFYSTVSMKGIDIKFIKVY